MESLIEEHCKNGRHHKFFSNMTKKKPSYKTIETAQDVHFLIDLPDVDRSDIHFDIHNGVLGICAFRFQRPPLHLLRGFRWVLADRYDYVEHVYLLFLQVSDRHNEELVTVGYNTYKNGKLDICLSKLVPSDKQ